MRHFIFALAIATPAFAYAQTPADLAALAWNGTAAPAETSSALAPAPGALTAAGLVSVQFPLGVVARSVSTAPAGVLASAMTGTDLVRLSGRSHGAPVVSVRTLALSNAGPENYYR